MYAGAIKYTSYHSGDFTYVLNALLLDLKLTLHIVGAAGWLSWKSMWCLISGL